jgi:Sulfotransferase family
MASKYGETRAFKVCSEPIFARGFTWKLLIVCKDQQKLKVTDRMSLRSFQWISGGGFRRGVANSTSPDRIAFLHIPKSAGSSISIGLEKSKFTKRVWGLFDEVLFGGFTDFDGMHDTVRNCLIHLPTTSVNPNWDAVSGHLSLPTIRRIFPQHRVFTVMREPRARLISHWLYWRAVRENERLLWGTWAHEIARADGPFKAFIQSKEIAAQTDNVVVRMLLGNHPLIPIDDFINPSADGKLFSSAKRAIGAIGFVGLTEDTLLDIKIGEYIENNYELPRVNVTDLSPEQRSIDFKKELDGQAIQTLYDRTRLDRRLWTDIADRLFDNAEAVAEASFLSTLLKHAYNSANS